MSSGVCLDSNWSLRLTPNQALIDANTRLQVHLRSRHESVSVLCLIYYMPYKVILTFVNIASCYYSIYKYAKYFAKRHPKVIEDVEAVAVVLKLEEDYYSETEKLASAIERASTDSQSHNLARRFTVTAVGTDLSSVAQDYQQGEVTVNIDVVDFATQPTAPYQNFRRPAPRVGRRLPTTSPPERPFSWRQRASNASADSNVSPFDESEKPRFLFSSPADFVEGENIPNKQASPLQHPRGSASTCSLRRWLSDPCVPGRRTSSSSRPNPSSQQPVIPHPTITRPAPAFIPQPYHFIPLSQAEEFIRQRPPRKVQRDMTRYISALADTDDSRPERREWLVIEEEGEGEVEGRASAETTRELRRSGAEEKRWSDRTIVGASGSRPSSGSRKSRIFLHNESDI